MRGIATYFRPWFSNPVSLRLFLVIPFVLQITAAVGLTGYWSWRNGQRAVQDLAGQLRLEVSDRIEQHLDAYLQVPQGIVQANVDAFNIGLLDPEDPALLEQHFVHQVRAQSIGYVLLGLETGEFLSAGHFFGDDRITIDAVDEATPKQGGVAHAFAVDGQGHRQQKLADLGPFLARKEGWYQQAVQQSHRSWSPVYNWLVEPYNLSIAVSEPLYRPVNSDSVAPDAVKGELSAEAEPQLLGVMAAEQQLTGISEFLRGLTVSASGQTFIIERDGRLIGSSTEDAPFLLEQGVPQRQRALDSREPLIRTTAEFLAQQFPDLNQIKTAQQLEFQRQPSEGSRFWRLEGARQFVQVTPWRDPLGLDWLVVVVMPEADFMAQIHTNAQQTLALCGLALVVATGLGIYTAHWITQPLLQLSDAAEHIALQAAQGTPALDFPSKAFHAVPPKADTERFQELSRLSHSFERMAMELQSSFQQLTHSAIHDALTGLPNRLALENQLQDYLEDETVFALLFLDLDYFKLVNDSLGHGVGDRLLQAVAALLVNSLGTEDVVARFGGDEFVILLAPPSRSTEALAQAGGKETEAPDMTHQAVAVAKQLIAQLQNPFTLGEREVFIGLSIGIVVATQANLTTMTAQEALRNADTALYRAKEQGKGGYAMFDCTMHAERLQRLQLETDLRHAIQRQELTLYYQPLVDTESGKIHGMEALLRWWSPRLQDYISPDVFVPIAEETGLILPLTTWVLQTACRQMRAWQMQFPNCESMVMHVNVASQQFLQAHWLEDLFELLRETELLPRCLGLEITERTLMSHGMLTQIKLQQLETAGIHISIDDFGTGYSSLSYLQQFPIHSLKIDRAFVQQLDSRVSESEAIIRAIAAMAHALEIKMVAEGVETQAQRQVLRHLGCQLIQGYCCARPCDAEVMTELLHRDAVGAAILPLEHSSGERALPERPEQSECSSAPTIPSPSA